VWYEVSFTGEAFKKRVHGDVLEGLSLQQTPKNQNLNPGNNLPRKEQGAQELRVGRVAETFTTQRREKLIGEYALGGEIRTVLLSKGGCGCLVGGKKGKMPFAMQFRNTKGVLPAKRTKTREGEGEGEVSEGTGGP